MLYDWLPDLTLGPVVVDFKYMASGDLRRQQFEEYSWIDAVKSSHDFVCLDHVSDIYSIAWAD